MLDPGDDTPVALERRIAKSGVRAPLRGHQIRCSGAEAELAYRRRDTVISTERSTRSGAKHRGYLNSIFLLDARPKCQYICGRNAGSAAETLLQINKTPAGSTRCRPDRQNARRINKTPESGSAKRWRSADHKVRPGSFP